MLISVIEKFCVPLVRGGSFDDLSKAMPGMKKNKRDNTWSLPLGGDKNYAVTVYAPGANKDVCRGDIHYAINQTDPIVKALNVWSFLHQPELILQANYVKVYDDGVKRVQRSWEHLEANASQAVNFTTSPSRTTSSVNRPNIFGRRILLSGTRSSDRPGGRRGALRRLHHPGRLRRRRPLGKLDPPARPRCRCSSTLVGACLILVSLFTASFNLSATAMEGRLVLRSRWRAWRELVWKKLRKP